MTFPKTVAIIQARMGSTRLPGKVMMAMGNRSLLGYLCERLSSSRRITAIVVATTTNHRDDVIVEEARKLGVDCFRGSETDVLERYTQAARMYNAEIVVRVTGDNPFTDPASIDRVVDKIVEGYDYAIEDGLPVGVAGEALTMQALEFTDRIALTPQWREHVTQYAKESPSMLRCAFLQARPECGRPDLSFTVDHLAEYKRALELSEKIPSPHFPLKDLIRLADTLVVVQLNDRS